MGRPRRRKALYEIIRSQAGDPSVPAARPAAPPAGPPAGPAGPARSKRAERQQRREARREVPPPRRSADGEAGEHGENRWNWLRPGQMIRLPAGYLLVGAAIVLMLVIGAYIVGFDRGESRGEAIDDPRFRLPALATDQRPPDPLNQRPPASAAERDRTEAPRTPPQANPPASATTTSAVPPQPAANRADWGPIESRHWREGLNHFVLAETTREGAVRLAEFCRASGLETYVVTGQNTRLFKVVASPGFLPSERSSAAVKELEGRIHRIGDRWKSQEPGATNLRDAYPMRFDP